MNGIPVAIVAFVLNNFIIICDAETVMTKNYIIFISDIHNFYKSSSIFIVYDKEYLRNLDIQSKVVAHMKALSHKSIMTQVISYSNGLARAMDSYTGDDYLAQSMQPLFFLNIDEKTDFERFKRVTAVRDISAYSWFANVNSTTSGLDCERPQGNPFNLLMDTRMIVKCMNSSSVKKYYSIFPNETEVIDLASWVPGVSLDIARDDDVLQVKKDMKGIKLKIAKQKQSARFPVHLLNILKNVSNFEYEIVIEENTLGYFNESAKRYFGIIGFLQDGKVDMSAALFMMSTSRLSVLDFSIPVRSAGTRFYMKLSGSANVHKNAYKQVIYVYVWIAIGLVIVSALLCVIKNKFRKPYISVKWFFENFIDIWGIYAQQGLAEPPSHTSTRILYFWILISAYIFNFLYAASITTTIALFTASLPFSNYNEFLQDNTYKLIVTRGSRLEDLIHTDDPVLGPLLPRLKNQEELPIHSFEGFEQACNEKVAFCTTEMEYVKNDVLPCNLGSLTIARIEYNSFAFPKNSPYRETINYNILKLMNYGVLKYLNKKYQPRMPYPDKGKPVEIALREVKPILVVWVTGLVTSSIIFCVEVVWHGWLRNQQMPSLRKNNVKRIAWQ